MGSGPMSAATLTKKGQIVIPADIRARYELVPGTQVEFVDEGGVIRLLVRRRVAVSDPLGGFGLVKVKPTRDGNRRRLSEFDPAGLQRRSRRKS
jgi:AbrB family looped-hinge helix DNA binding protein